MGCGASLGRRDGSSGDDPELPGTGSSQENDGGGGGGAVYLPTWGSSFRRRGPARKNTPSTTPTPTTSAAAAAATARLIANATWSPGGRGGGGSSIQRGSFVPPLFRPLLLLLPPPPRCAWLQFSIGGCARAERLVFELFADVAPRTCANFGALCTGAAGVGPHTRAALHYRGTALHRVVRGFVCQGGDIEMRSGAGGESIYGRCFPDETFEGPAGRHAGLGTLSMANRGPNTNASQFFICFADAPQLDGQHVVFGRAVAGLEVLRAIEAAAATKSGAPRTEVKVVDCGIAESTSAAVVSPPPLLQLAAVAREVMMQKDDDDEDIQPPPDATI